MYGRVWSSINFKLVANRCPTNVPMWLSATGSLSSGFSRRSSDLKTCLVGRTIFSPDEPSSLKITAENTLATKLFHRMQVLRWG